MICSASSLAACPRAVAPHLSSWEAGLQKPQSCCVPQEVTPFWASCIGTCFLKTVCAPALSYAGSEIWSFVWLRFTSLLLSAPGSCVLWDMDKSAPLCSCAVSGMVLHLYPTSGLWILGWAGVCLLQQIGVLVSSCMFLLKYPFA